MATRKRKNGLVFFLLAFLLIVILIVIAFFMRDQLIALVLPQEEQPTEVVVAPTPVMYDIVVIIQPVKRGDALTEAMLGTVSYPQEDMVEGLFYTNIMDVIGKRAKYDLDPGTPLTPGLLSEGQTGSFLSFEIPDGMVAITVPIGSEQRKALSYSLKPGDHVNILAGIKLYDLDQDFQTKLPNEVSTLYKYQIFYGENGPVSLPVDLTLRLDGSSYLGRIYQDPSVPDEFLYIIPSEDQRPRWVTQTVVQNAYVLLVGDQSLADETTTTAATDETVEADQAPVDQYIPEPRRITVAVSQQDAVSLNYLILTNADLNFVLRSAGDEQLVQTEPVTLQFIMDQYNIPYPSKLPYGIDMSDSVFTENVTE